MNRLRDLAEDVEKQWAQCGRHLAAFPNIANRALQDLDYDLSVSELDQAVAKWMLSPLPLPEQINVHNTFGQPPVTLFNNGHFVVDIYFWLNFDTAIHSHGFRGAFRVLHGTSLQEVFRARVEKELAKDVALIHLEEPQRTILKPGDVRLIEPGRELIHRVVHLENPTITLCVKTVAEKGLQQWNYFANGLAIQKRQIEAGLVKRIYYYEYLLGRDSELAASYLSGILSPLDASTQMNLFEEIGSGNYGLAVEATELLMEAIYAKHSSSEWFQRYEAFNNTHLNSLGFMQTDSCAARLVAHAINSGIATSTLLPLLEKATGRSFSAADLRSVALGLLEVEDVFQQELQDDDRALVQALLREPGREVPEHLLGFQQISKLRQFLNPS